MSAPTSATGPVVLVAPLDWGLGHATRCIPIIRGLIGAGASVMLAGSGASGALLRQEFPSLPYTELPATDIRYARTRRGLVWKILQQVPKLRQVVEAENRWLKQWLNSNLIHGLISDNRYGLYHPTLPCILVTHQLEIRTPIGRWADRLLRAFHYRLIRRFDACWVPDGPSAPGLAGTLSHPSRLPPGQLRYLGPLSRFTASTGNGHGRLLVLLSGPEPQRTLFEQLLLPQLSAYASPVLLVRGLPEGGPVPPLPANVEAVNHLPGKDLQTELSAASFVLARCGYSTVMDLAALRVRGILVPTPGQTEQEYLAGHLPAQGLAPCFPQDGFSLVHALSEAARFQYRFPPPASALLEETIQDWLGQLRKDLV